ncbi:methylmalonyl Co-A mutase-associated GTPase MeaB [bacterium]|nr:methylmalonyl Co-A mutase-associated GTPase MeaB [bacterium]
MTEKARDLLQNFSEGNVVALAKIISIIENRSEGYEDILSKLFLKSSNAYRIGITGPTGAGKSTVVDKIAYALAQGKHDIGIIAVDPSSPYTGGAVLGDRVRMKDLFTFDNVFIRSMATRGSLGGLASATKDVLIAFDSFGKDYIIVETIGVGQVELDVVDACDTVVVILTPEGGDSIQAMKAGLIEIADIFVINKSDRDGADIFAQELQSILEMREGYGEKSKWQIPIISTVAVTNQGIDELLAEIGNHKKFISDAGVFEVRRKAQIEHRVRDIIQHHVNQIAKTTVLNKIDIDRLVQGVYAGKIDPYSAVREYMDLERFKKMLEEI